MAALIKDKLGLEVELIRAGGGEFTVWVDDRKVAAKSYDGFPEDQECLTAVQQAVAAQTAT